MDRRVLSGPASNPRAMGAPLGIRAWGVTLGLVAAAAGSVACWGCFGAAFTRGRGGPVLDVTVYPLAVVAVCPVAVRWAAHGVDAPAGLGVVLFPVDALLAGAALVLPGASFAASMLAFWGAGLGDEGVREWQRAHLREDFAEAFLEERER